MTKSRKILRPRKAWSPQEQTLLREYYPDQLSRDLAAAFGCTLSQIYNQAWKMGLSKSKAFIAENARENSNKPNHGGVACRFKPGQTPPNKGVKGYCAPGSEKGHFRKGNKSFNYQEIGALRINGDGYLDIKLEDGLRGWYSLALYSWFLAHGSYPDTGMCIRYRDKDAHNTDPENLYLVTQRENMLLNTIQRYPKDLRNVMILNGRLKKRITKIQEANHG